MSYFGSKLFISGLRNNKEPNCNNCLGMLCVSGAGLPLHYTAQLILAPRISVFSGRTQRSN